MGGSQVTCFAAAVLVLVALAPTQSQGKAQSAGQRKAPQKTQAELKVLRDQKLKSPFLQKAAWTTSLASAKKSAKAGDKLILAYFTRSFAPSPGIAHLEDRLFLTSEFQAIVKSVVLFCHVTTRVEGDPDQDLMQRLQGRGFPFLVALDEAGRPVARFHGELSLAGLKGFLSDEVAAYADLRARAAKGEKQAKADFLIQRIRLGHLKPDEIQSALAKADYLSKAQKATIRNGLVSLEIREILARIDGKDPASFNRAAERVVAMKNAGRIPAGREAPIFWQVILGYADANEDPALFKEALDTIEKLPGPKRPEQWLRRMKMKLKALEFMKGKRRK